MSDGTITRRELLQATALAGSALLVPEALAAPAQEGLVPRRAMGRTGLQCSILGLGGYHLGSTKDQAEASNIVSRAMDAGVNFFDNCWEYHDGESEKRLGQALKGRRDKAIVMTKVCTHGRDKAVAMKMLEDSLRRLQTDHLDVWQIHEVIYDNDPELIFVPNGAAEALVQAKKQGKVRFVGFTGHKDPAIHLKMLAHDFPFDIVQMPLNPLDGTFRSFAEQVLPKANERGFAVFGMKSFGGSGEIVRHKVLTPAEALRYAMSLPVATTISGIDSMAVLEQNLAIATKFQPMSPAEMQALRDRCRPVAADGRYELFKSSKEYDADIGRAQHGFPTQKQLPL